MDPLGKPTSVRDGQTGFDGLITFFGTRDLEATHYFYAGLLGLELWLDQGLCRIYRVRPGAYLGFCEHMPEVPPEQSPIVCLVTDDVDGRHADLVAAGVPVDGPPRVNPRFGIYHFFSRDPNGYRVEVQRFLGPPPGDSEG